MRLDTLSNVLEKVYNKLGNKYLTDNFVTEPFEFKVNVRYDRDNEYYDYIVDVYSIPDIPKGFEYKPEIKEMKKTDGIDISVLKHEFKQMIKYVDDSFSKRIYGVNFVNQIK